MTRYMSPGEIDAMLPRSVEPEYVRDGPVPWADEPAIGARPRPAQARPTGLVALSWDEVLAEPPTPPPMLRRSVPEVGLTVLAGSPKVGKTLWASQTALETGVRTLLVAEEGSLSGISYRLRRQAAALDVAVPPITVMHRQRIRLDDRRSVAGLRDYVEHVRPALVVVDPLNRAHGADENRPTQMTPVMDALAGIAYDFGCAVLCVHHLAKPSAERRGDIWDRFRGATSIRSGTDANLVLDGAGEHVRLVGEFRDAEPLTEYLELDRETLLFRSAEAPQVGRKIAPAALAEFLTGRTQVTVREVAQHFGTSKNTAAASLEASGLDAYDGPRGTRFYVVAGTAQ